MPDGSERIAYIDIDPWSATVAQFHWTTPEGGHYCLLAICEHPDDAVPGNNIGQKNVLVANTAPGRTVTTELRITNTYANAPQRLQLSADTYTIPDANIELALETIVTPIAPGWPTARNARGPVDVRYGYNDGGATLALNRQVPSSIPAGWQLAIDGNPLGLPIALDLGPGEERMVTVTIQLPAGAIGTPVSFNITAAYPQQGLFTGVTIRVGAG
jgi:hypothetical protein